MTGVWQVALIQRLIETGPDPLVSQVCRRISTDRDRSLDSPPSDLLSWLEIAAWAHGLGLLDGDEVSLLSRLERTGAGPVQASRG